MSRGVYSNSPMHLTFFITLYKRRGMFVFPFQVMEKALLHMANCYLIPNIRGVGYLCKTNISSTTAFRGFGAPQVREKEY